MFLLTPADNVGDNVGDIAGMVSGGMWSLGECARPFICNGVGIVHNEKKMLSHKDGLPNHTRWHRPLRCHNCARSNGLKVSPCSPSARIHRLALSALAGAVSGVALQQSLA